MLSRTWLLGRTSGLSTYSRQYTPKKVGWLRSIWSHPTHNYSSFRFREVVSANICNFKETNNLSQIMQWLERYEGMRDRVLTQVLLFLNNFWHLLSTNEGNRMFFRRDLLTMWTVIPIFKKKYCAIPLSDGTLFTTPLSVAIRSSYKQFCFPTWLEDKFFFSIPWRWASCYHTQKPMCGCMNCTFYNMGPSLINVSKMQKIINNLCQPMGPKVCVKS